MAEHQVKDFPRDKFAGYWEKFENDDGTVTARVYAKEGPTSEFTGSEDDAEGFIGSEMASLKIEEA